MRLNPTTIVGIAVAAIVAMSLINLMLKPAELVSWTEGAEMGFAESRRTGKPVLLYFTASWCGPCQQMARTTWADAHVAAATEQVIPVKIDVDRFPKIAEEHQVQAIPTMIVVNADAVPTARSTGYLDAQQFVAWLSQGVGSTGQR